MQVTVNDKLIVHNYDDPIKTGIYDLTTKTLVTIDGLPSAFGGTPVRPDGRGFIVTRKDTATAVLQVFLADWEGKTQPIDMKPNAIDGENKIS